MTPQEIAAAVADVVQDHVRLALAPALERMTAVETKLGVLGDLRDRVVAIETKAAAPIPTDAAVYELRERVAVMEVKAAPVMGVPPDVLSRIDALEARPNAEAVTPPVVDLSPIVERLSKLEMDVVKEIGTVRERLAVVETKAPIPGPAGQDGKDGLNGQDGKDGADGLGFDDLAVEQTDERTIVVKAMRGLTVKEIGTFRFPVEIYRGVFVEGKQYERGDGVTWGGSEWHCNEATTVKPGDGSKAWTLKVKKGRDGRDGKDAASIPVVKVS